MKTSGRSEASDPDEWGWEAEEGEQLEGGEEDAPEELKLEDMPQMPTELKTREDAERWIGSMSWLAGSPARTSALRDAVRDLRANEADYGLSTSDAFAWFDPSTLSWRTFQVSLTGDSTPFLGVWPLAGTMRRGIVYQQQVLGRAIDVTEYSSLVREGEETFPTPQAMDGILFNCPPRNEARASGLGKHNRRLSEMVVWRTPDAHLGKRGPKSREGYEDSLKHGTHAVNLLDQVRHGFLPTPLSTDWKCRGPNSRDFPTPTSADSNPKRMKYKRGNLTLQGAVTIRQTYPTPTAHCQDRGTMEMARYSGQARQRGSPGSDYDPEVGGQLNPPWVEWLMAFRIGHTACAPSETPSSPPSPSSSGLKSSGMKGSGLRTLCRRGLQININQRHVKAANIGQRRDVRPLPFASGRIELMVQQIGHKAKKTKETDWKKSTDNGDGKSSWVR